MGWLVDADGLDQILQGVQQAPGLPLYITENGRAAEDDVKPQGKVDDVQRVRYLHTHLEAAARAYQGRVSLAGRFPSVVSLLGQLRVGCG